MFHTIITLSYLVPGIYLFVRIWQLFIPREYVLIYIPVFILLYLIYPLSNFSGGDSFLSEAAVKIAGYILPFLLYLFLIVLMTDILLLVNYLFRINLLNRVINKNPLIFLAVVITLAGVIVSAGVINFNTIRYTKYKVTIPGGSSDLDSLRIAFVSDFHLEPGVPKQFVRSFVKKVEAAKPDLLLFGGDIVEGRGEGISAFEDMIRSIKLPYGMYGVLGNHDRFTDYKNNFFTRSGINLLADSVIVLDNSFSIVGRIDNQRLRKHVKDLVPDVPGDLPMILLDHRPVDYDNISDAGADIVFSGHTHKGQMFPVNIYINSLYEISYGHLKKGSSNFYVSSGIRLWGPPVRTTGKSEIVIVDVNLK